MDITLSELEQAINFWRSRRPSRGEERALSPEVDALATIYATMIYKRAQTVPSESIDDFARQLIESWRKHAG